MRITDSPIFLEYAKKETEGSLHILCECVALVKLRFNCEGKHFTEPSDYNTSWEVRHYWRNEVHGDAQYIRKWSRYKGPLHTHSTLIHSFIHI
jgi:hypothetical protein